jgi:hypothetical protein
LSEVWISIRYYMNIISIIVEPKYSIACYRTTSHTPVSPRCISVLFFRILDTFFTFSSEKFRHLIMNAVSYWSICIHWLGKAGRFLCIQQSLPNQNTFSCIFLMLLLPMSVY